MELDFNYVEILDAVKIELKSTPEQTRMGAGAFLEQLWSKIYQVSTGL